MYRKLFVTWEIVKTFHKQRNKKVKKVIRKPGREMKEGNIGMNKVQRVMLGIGLSTVIVVQTTLAFPANTGVKPHAEEIKENYVVYTKTDQALKEVEKKYDISEEATEEYKELLEEENITILELTESQAEKLDVKKDVIVEHDMLLEGSSIAEEEILSEEEQKAIRQMIKDSWNIRAVHAEKTEAATDNPIKIAVLDSGIGMTNDITVSKRVDLVEEETYFLSEDMTGHGTGVASIIAAHKNDIGTTGVARGISLHSVRVLDENNQAPVSRIVAGIQWCMEHDIDIINMSFGTTKKSKILEAVIKEAEAQGILLIASTGNRGNSSENKVEYPAAYQEVVAVGSIDSDLKISETSSTGEEVELVAPGELVPIEGDFEMVSIGTGTSFAAPHVTAVAALLWGENPKADNRYIRALLDASARKLGGKETYGYGLVDYQYAKEIVKDFEDAYSPAVGKEEKVETVVEQLNIEENEAELEEYEIPACIQANWGGDEHKALITNSVENSSNSMQSVYPDAKLKVIRKAAKFADDAVARNTGAALHANYPANYIATTKYLYTVAINQRKNPKKKISVILSSTKYYGTASDKPALDKVIELTCAQTGFPTYKYAGKTEEENKGLNRSLRILGLATHVVGDSYSHKAILPTGAYSKIHSYEEKNYKEKTFDDKNIANLQKEIATGTMTFVGLAKYRKDVNSTKLVNTRYIDNTVEGKADPNSKEIQPFYQQRYAKASLWGVQQLLSDYYSGNAFNLKTFYCYNNPNWKSPYTIKQYRLYDFAKEANGGANPNKSGMNFKTYSVLDTSK